MNNFLAITTCNLNDTEGIREDLRRTVESLRRFSDSRILIIDDGSPPDYQSFVKNLAGEFSAQCSLIPENVGIARSKNHCLEAFLESDCDVVFLLDDDIEIRSTDFERAYVDAIEIGPHEIFSYNDLTYLCQLPFDVDGFAASTQPCGVCVVASRLCVEVTGYFLEMPGRWGMEHVEYSARAAARGFAPEGLFLDVWGSVNLLRIASHRSVFTGEEKAASETVNRAFMESQAVVNRNVTGVAEYCGIKCQQIAGFDRLLSRMIRNHGFTHVAEIGTGHGGFARFLRDALPSAVIQTWDVAVPDAAPQLERAGIELFHSSVFTPSGGLDSRLVSFIKNADRLAVFVDGGNKPEELAAVAPLLKRGDFVMVHDYADTTEQFDWRFRGRIWNWLEITLGQIQSRAECRRLKPRHPELKHLMWGCFESE